MILSDSENTKSKVARFKPSRRFYVFLISLFLASAFWLLNALNKTYVEDVHIAIKYINLPVNRAFSPVPPSSIKIELSGDGYSLMQLMNAAEEDTVVIDLEDIEFVSRGSRKKASIPTSVVINELRSSLSNGVNVSRVSRDTIVINTEIGSSVNIPVKPNFNISLDKGFVLVRPVYTVPNMVRVHGAKSLIEKTLEIETEHISFNNLNETDEREVLISCNRRFLQPNYQKVKIIAEIEHLTEGEIEVPVVIVGLPKDIKLRLIPNTIKVKYTTGLSHFDFIEPELFRVVVNYDDILAKPSKVQVNTVSFPTYLNIIQLTPERVNYLIFDLTE